MTEPTAGLSLPTLPEGWTYEGWAVIDGVPVTTGTFLSVDVAAEAAPYSGDVSDGPTFPGEDFLENAPEGLDFPVDLSSGTIVPEDSSSNWLPSGSHFGIQDFAAVWDAVADHIAAG